MTFGRFEFFLKEAMGLDTPSVGAGSIERAVRERASACGRAELEDYWILLQGSEAERQQLIEAVVVPETWFFRDPGAFAALARVAVGRETPAASGPLRVLSIPCSTGEEPYSIAMTLMDAGLAPERFAIDAVDISERAIEYARQGQYRRNSFRGADQGFRERHFTDDRLHQRIRESVQFRQHNLFTFGTAAIAQSYNIIFCRNLLIYFDRPTQDRAVAALTRLLTHDGILFIGPSESGLFLDHQFESMNWPMAFAFRKPSVKKALPAALHGQGAEPPRLPPAKRPASSARAASAARKMFIIVPGATAPEMSRVTSAASRGTVVAPPAGGSQQQTSAASSVDLLNEAQQLADQGNTAAARERCDAFLLSNGSSAQAYYLLGLLHDAAGETAAAIEDYRRALYLDPNHQETLIHLAILIEHTGDIAGANRLYERAKRAASRGGVT